MEITRFKNQFTHQDLLECFSVIETSYGKLFEFDETKTELMQRTWLSALQEFPKNVVKKAVFDLCKSEKYPPSLSQVINESKSIYDELVKSNEFMKLETAEQKELREWLAYSDNLNADEKLEYFKRATMISNSEEVENANKYELKRAGYLKTLRERFKEDKL